MSHSTLVIIGSGPGIGLSTATIFACNKFNTVVLISRDGTRIQQDRKTLLDSLSPFRSVEVKTFSVDIANTKAFNEVLSLVKKIEHISCVIFNAARVAPSQLLGYPEEELLLDFQVRLLLMHFSMPKLKKLDHKHCALHRRKMGCPDFQSFEV